jgi:hypothetical protein
MIQVDINNYAFVLLLGCQESLIELQIVGFCDYNLGCDDLIGQRLVPHKIRFGDDYRYEGDEIVKLGEKWIHTTS